MSTGAVRARWPATVTLAMVTAAAAVGHVRVFDDPSFLVPLLVTVALGHVLAALTRPLPFGLATLVMIGGGILVTVDLTHLSATTLGVPTPSTFGVLGENLDASVETLRNSVAPVAPDAGLVFAVAAALWTVAWSSDRLTFAFDAPIEALVPSGTVFVVVTALAGSQHRWLSAALWGTAVALHLLVYRNLRGDAVSPGAWRPIARGGVLAAGALVVGLGAAASVPALSTDGVLALREQRTITVVSPLVDIRSRLVDQTDQVLFTVEATRPEYWRLMALDSFDGQVWTPPNSRVPRAEHFLSSDGTKPPSERIRAVFELSGLGGVYAPAPFRPSYVSDLVDTDDRDASPSLLWDDDYATLIASSETGTVTDLRYTINADVPRVSKAAVEDVHGFVPAEIGSRFTALPDEFPDDLTFEAHRIIAEAGAHTPYQKALALQDHFQDPANGFTYSTEVPAPLQGESTDAIREFLTTKVGFCEQYAGTYAALGRAVGLPTRIAVGFTWGQAEPGSDADTTRFVVTGRNAHAWPEVYFAGLGWLPFEPTPGRGNPAAASYSGLIPAQDDTALADGPQTPTTTQPDVPPTTTPGSLPDLDEPPASAATEPDGGASSGPSTTVVRLGIAAALAAVVLGTAPALRWIRRRVRRRRANTPAGRVRLVWNEALDQWRSLDLVRAPVDTDRDLGRRLSRRIGNLAVGGDVAVQAERLAELAGAAAWNAPGITDAEADEAAEAAAQVAEVARRYRSRWSRLVGWFDPRPGAPG